MLSEVLARCLEQVKAEEQAKVSTPTTGIAIPQAPKKPNAPTDKQIDFFRTLVKGKQLDDEQRMRLLDSLPTQTKQTITSTIQWLIGLPWMQRTWVPRAAAKTAYRPSTTPPKLRISEGYYAITDPQDAILKFYQVRTPKEGKWAGYVFLSEVSGENHIPVRVKIDRDRIFGEIAKNPIEALKRYGKEIGRCGHCRKQLTDEVSRAFGIGPVCRKDLGI